MPRNVSRINELRAGRQGVAQAPHPCFDSAVLQGLIDLARDQPDSERTLDAESGTVQVPPFQSRSMVAAGLRSDWSGGGALVRFALREQRFFQSLAVMTGPDQTGLNDASGGLLACRRRAPDPKLAFAELVNPQW